MEMAQLSFTKPFCIGWLPHEFVAPAVHNKTWPIYPERTWNGYRVLKANLGIAKASLSIIFQAFLIVPNALQNTWVV